MKKIIALVLALVLCTSVVAFAANAPKDVTVEIDGKVLEFDQPPIIDNGRTLVPVRKIFEELGATVDYDGATQTVISRKGDLIIVMQINNDVMFVNSEPKKLDVPAKIVSDRTLVPVRAISESMGVEVIWDNDTRTVKLFTE